MTDLEQDFLIERAKNRDLEDRLIRVESRGRCLFGDMGAVRSCLEEIHGLALELFGDKPQGAARIAELAGEALAIAEKWSLKNGKRRQGQGGA